MEHPFTTAGDNPPAPQHTKRQRKVKITAMLTPEEAELLEAWRQQHAFGRISMSHAVRGLISIYLGVNRWPPNAPGFGIAWQKTLGWDLQDPRPCATTNKPTRLRLV